MYDEFSVETPVILKQRGGDEPEVSRRFVGAINGVHLFIFSDPTERHGSLEMVRDVLPKIGGSRDILPTDGSSSGTASFKDTFGYWHNFRTYRTETRFYLVQTLALDENDEAASRFLRSFSQVQKLQSTPASPLSAQIIDRRTSTGEQPAAGIGSSVPASTSTSGTPLRIVGKPRPGYTDLARTYGIEGTVSLEVTFLENGQVGTVKALSGLPFGLTQSGIEAASKISFEPATENGVPVTVTKKIEYSYSIY